jgi:hypothetical protein
VPVLLVLAAVPVAALVLAHARSRRDVAATLAVYLGVWAASAAAAVAQLS